MMENNGYKLLDFMLSYDYKENEFTVQLSKRADGKYVRQGVFLLLLQYS